MHPSQHPAAKEEEFSVPFQKDLGQRRIVTAARENTVCAVQCAVGMVVSSKCIENGSEISLSQKNLIMICISLVERKLKPRDWVLSCLKIQLCLT